MIDLQTIRTLLKYSDWANIQLLNASLELSNEQLDRPFDMGPGSLRRTLLHIFNGEFVWLQRWRGRVETPWPPESEPVDVAALAERFRATWTERDEFLASLPADAPARTQNYRDSRGGLFQATLGDMLVQGCTHSLHHRAQAVNMLRRLGAAPPELDYMMWQRRTAE